MTGTRIAEDSAYKAICEETRALGAKARDFTFATIEPWEGELYASFWRQKPKWSNDISTWQRLFERNNEYISDRELHIANSETLNWQQCIWKIAYDNDTKQYKPLAHDDKAKLKKETDKAQELQADALEVMRLQVEELIVKAQNIESSLLVLMGAINRSKP